MPNICTTPVLACYQFCFIRIQIEESFQDGWHKFIAQLYTGIPKLIAEHSTIFADSFK